MIIAAFVLVCSWNVFPTLGKPTGFHSGLSGYGYESGQGYDGHNHGLGTNLYGIHGRNMADNNQGLQTNARGHQNGFIDNGNGFGVNVYGQHNLKSNDFGANANNDHGKLNDGFRNVYHKEEYGENGKSHDNDKDNDYRYSNADSNGYLDEQGGLSHGNSRDVGGFHTGHDNFGNNHDRGYIDNGQRAYDTTSRGRHGNNDGYVHLYPFHGK